jgi:hypothetical protein
MLSQGVSNHLGYVGDIRPSTEPGIWKALLPVRQH